MCCGNLDLLCCLGDLLQESTQYQEVDKFCRLSHSAKIGRDSQACDRQPYSIVHVLDEIVDGEFQVESLLLFSMLKKYFSLLHCSLIFAFLAHLYFFDPHLFVSFEFISILYLAYILTTPLLHHRCCPLLNLRGIFLCSSCLISVTLILGTSFLLETPYS